MCGPQCTQTQGRRSRARKRTERLRKKRRGRTKTNCPEGGAGQAGDLKHTHTHTHTRASTFSHPQMRRAATAAAAAARRASTVFFPPPASHPPPDFPPSCRLLDGVAASAAWCDEMAPRAAALARVLGRRPSLAVVLAGDRPDSLLYVQRKLEAAARIGVDARAVRLPVGAGTQAAAAAVAAAAADTHTDGVVIQLPLPPSIDAHAVLAALGPEKDVDGFHPANVGRLLSAGVGASFGGGGGGMGGDAATTPPPSSPPAFIPATALGVLQLLRRSSVPLAGRTAVVLGDSAAVGLPLALLLRSACVAATTLCHRGAVASLFAGGGDHDHQQDATTASDRAAAGACAPNAAGGSGGDAASPPLPREELASLVRRADLVVAAIGSPASVPGAWIKRGAVVVDVGINVVTPGDGGGEAATVRGGGNTLNPCSSSTPSLYTVVGDVHPSASAVASAMTPVPGGVGPMTIAALLSNTLDAAAARAGGAATVEGGAAAA